VEILVVCLGLFVVFFLPSWIRQNLYKRTTYFQITQKPLSQLDKGETGEYLIYQKLKQLEKRGGRFLFNLFLPKSRNETTEVDVVLIHPKGLFVFESKNYSGWIFGNQVNRTWTQVLPRGRGYQSNKERFQNPIHQNANHIKYLKRIVGEGVPMWSVVVFSDECEFKDVSVSSEARFKVIQLCELKAMIGDVLEKTNVDVFSAKEVESIYNQLFPYSQVGEEVRQEHINQLKSERW
jgi:hypothetical protein